MSAMLPITLYDMLDEIRHRTAMYVGDNSILQLRAFLAGFSWAEDKLGLKLTTEIPSFGGFHDWVAKKFGWYESTAGWANIILQENNGDEQRAGRAFFELLDEFRNGPPVTPQDRGPFGRKGWNTWEYAVIFDCSGDSIKAFSPDLPGFVASGNSVTEVEQLMKQAIEQHLKSQSQDGTLISPPRMFTRSVQVQGIPRTT